LRGRETVRPQSAILDKCHSKSPLLLSITVFLVRMVFIRTKNTVGARPPGGLASLRSAQLRPSPATALEMSYMTARCRHKQSRFTALFFMVRPAGRTHKKSRAMHPAFSIKNWLDQAA
jgi:hypothetical protein